MSEPVDAEMRDGEQPGRQQLREEESGGYSEPQPEHDSPGPRLSKQKQTRV